MNRDFNPTASSKTIAPNHPTIIIGAGIGGLSAAIRLAVAGQRVIIYEKNSQVGGKMGQWMADGYRWDTGPSVITMRPVFEELFASAGRQLDDYLTFVPVEPLTRYFYPDGIILDASRDLPNMLAQIEELDPLDVEGYLAYLAYAARIHRITGPVFIYDQPPTVGSFTKVPIREWLKVDGLRTMDSAICHFVRSPHLRQLLGRFATYVGASPYLAPATLNVIAHVELAGGVWYPKGGIYRIAEAMARLATELGVEIQTDCGVNRILTKDGVVTGIQLADGQEVQTETIISNLDVTTTYSRLLLPYTGKGATHATFQEGVTRTISSKNLSDPFLEDSNHFTTDLRSRFISNRKTTTPQEPSCSGFVLLLGINKTHPQLAHHNIFFSTDYPAEFQAIFEQGVPPDEPTIYVAITAKADPDHAPTGCENWFILVNAPPLGEQYDWDKQSHHYRDLVLQRLAAHGYDIRPNIVYEHILTPQDLAEATGAWRGALYGASSNSRWAAFKRPNNRAKEPKGLYFAGGTTHPGGGVPMVTLSGKVAAEMVLSDRS